VEFVPLDFMTDATIAAASIYYVRHVLHDWPDEVCSKILAGIKKSMTKQSKLFIHEYVLQHVVRETGKTAKFEQVPVPLLPNYGLGRIRMYNQDMNMLSNFNSKERTLGEFVSMGENSRLRFVKLWDAGETSIVAFSLA